MCPKYVGYVGNDFNCSNNLLSLLEYGSESVGTSYKCDHNKLITLINNIKRLYLSC